MRQVKHDTRQVKHDTRQVKHDTRQVKHDTRQVKHDTRQVKHDTRQVKHDTRQHDTRQVKYAAGEAWLMEEVCVEDWNGRNCVGSREGGVYWEDQTGPEWLVTVVSDEMKKSGFVCWNRIDGEMS